MNWVRCSLVVVLAFGMLGCGKKKVEKLKDHDEVVTDLNFDTEDSDQEDEETETD